MPLARFRREINEAHLGQWLDRRVAVLEILEDRTPEGIFALIRDSGEEIAVALDD